MNSIISTFTDATNKLLQNPAKEEKEMNSDRVSVSATANAASATQFAVKPSAPREFVLTAKDNFWSMSYSMTTMEENLNKMVYCAHYEWSENNEPFNRIARMALPKSLITKVNPSSGVARYFKYLRCSMKFLVQVNAPPGAMGGLLVTYFPRGSDDMHFYTGSLLNTTHILINLATMTEAEIFIPYVSDENFVNWRDTDALGYLDLFVWSKYDKPKNGSNTADIAVYGQFVDLQFQGPIPVRSEVIEQDYIKISNYTMKMQQREKIDISEGPGVLNLANSRSTSLSQTTALASERAIFDRTTAGSKVAYQSLVKIAQTYSVPASNDELKTPLAANHWNASTAPGHEIFKANLTMKQMGNIGRLSHSFKCFRGSLKFRLTFFNSCFHRGRCKFVINPSGNDDFDNNTSSSLLYILCDLGLQSTFELTMPYTGKNWMTSFDNFDTIRIGLFVVNRLQYTDVVAQHVRYVITVAAGDDFQFFIPRGTTTTWQSPMKSWGSQADLAIPLDEGEHPSEYFEAEGANPTITSQENSGDQDKQVDSQEQCLINYKLIKPTIYFADHAKISNYFGRAWEVYDQTWSSAREFVVEFNRPSQGHASIMSMFYLFAGELNIHLVNSSDNFLSAAFDWDDDMTDKLLAGRGEIVIPPMETFSFKAPFYSKTPLRKLINTASFGRLGVLPYATSGRLKIFLSFTNPNFFYMLPFTTSPTLAMVLERPEQYLTTDDHFESLMQLDGVDLKSIYKPPTQRKLTHNLEKFGHFLQRSLWMRQLESEQENQSFDYGKLFKEMAVVAIPFSAFMIGKSIKDVQEALDDFRVKRIIKTCSEWKRDLTREGVEPNPGPVQLLWKERGLYKHYGVGVGDYVYMMDSEDVLSTIATGEVEIVKVKNDGKWNVETEFDLAYFHQKVLEGKIGEKHRFSCKDNCETFARSFFPEGGWSQSKALGVLGSLLITITSSKLLFGELNYQCVQEMVDAPNDEGAMTSAINRAIQWFSKTFTETMENHLVSTILKGLVRLTCYLVLYCHSPNLITTAALGALIFMDLSALKAFSPEGKSLLESLLNGDVRALVTGIVERVQGIEDDDETRKDMMMDTVKYTKSMMNEGSLDDFNKSTLAAKNFQWWIDLFKQLLACLKRLFKPKTSQKFSDWLDSNTELVARMFTTVNHHLKLSKDMKNLRDPKFQEFHMWLQPRLASFVTACNKYQIKSELSRQAQTLLTAMNNVPIVKPNNEHLARIEPLGVCIMGAAGQGKSFACQVLVKEICKMQNWTNSDVYSHPTSSPHFDGYNGQPIHVIDDMGQHVEEEDITVLCQCISSIPFIVPMASLEEKGTFYTSKLVVATTNKTDFTTKSLLDPNALKRRFPFTFHLRAKQCFTKDNKLDFNRHVDVVKEGRAWEFSKDGYEWLSLDLMELAREISNTLDQRMQSFETWNSFINEGPSFEDDLIEGVEEQFEEWAFKFKGMLEKHCNNIFDWDLEDDDDHHILLPSSSKIKNWLLKQVEKLKKFCEKNRHWIMLCSGVASALGLLTTVYLLVRNKRKEQEDHRAYNPQLQLKKKDNRFIIGKTVDVTSNESPYVAEVIHLAEMSAYIKADNTKEELHVLPICENKIVCYAHLRPILQALINPVLVYKHKEFKIANAEFQLLYRNGEPMDLALITIPAFPIKFRNCLKYLEERIGGDPMLIWQSSQGMLAMPVQQPFVLGVNVTREGDTCAKSIAYGAPTAKGMCGGILVSRVDGAFKIHGMHIAGNGQTGRSASMVFLKNIPENQGIILSKEPTHLYVHQPNKSKLKPSILSTVWEEQYQPAPLSHFDDRIKVDIGGSLIKHAAAKYRVNVFKPNLKVFLENKHIFKCAMFDTLGQHGVQTLEEACLEVGDHGLDLTSSPGLKYLSRNLKKKDLIKREQKFISPVLVNDVKEILDKMCKGEKQDVKFYAHIKDELRPLAKVALGNSRCIEASDFDYVVANKIVFGNLYKAIYQVPPQVLGIAVGMNPWSDWHCMIESLWQRNYCFDFSKFDGSLSAELMTHAAEVLCSCLEKPEWGMNLLEAAINSEHVVLDEKWTIHGGMPSGAPCTSVLNSCCNILVSSTLASECTEGLFKIICYGDDLIISTTEPMDCVKFQKLAKEYFGMEVTPEDKGETFTERGPREVVFLKRSTKNFPGTATMVGALDQNELRQHLRWCKSKNTFPSQLLSGLYEMVLHGESEYNKLREEIMPMCKAFGLSVRPFELSLEDMVRFVYE